MQVNNYSNRNNSQSFGALYISEPVKNRLALTLKKTKHIDEFKKLVDSQENNPVVIDLREELGRFTAYIQDAQGQILDQLNEGYFEKHFSNPLKFIKKCCKSADKFNENIYLSNVDKGLLDTLNKVRR